MSAVPLVVLVELQPDGAAATALPAPGSAVERLALALLDEAETASVRVKEALAVVMARCGVAAVPLAPPGESRELRCCIRIARRALAGSIPDPTRGAARFHRVDRLPGWARGRTPSAVIGDYLFYPAL